MTIPRVAISIFATAIGMAGLLLPSAPVLAFGKKSDICGSWNNYCRGGRRTAPTYRTSPTPWRPYRQQNPSHTRALQFNAQGIRYFNLAKAARKWSMEKVQYYWRAAQYFRSAYRLWPHRTIRASLYRAMYSYNVSLGARAWTSRNCAVAASYYRQAARWSSVRSPSDVRILNQAIRNADRCARRTGSSPYATRRKTPPSYRVRTCSACNRALVSDIGVRLGNPRWLRSYVSQSRAKYANCVRRIPGMCRQSSVYWKNRYALDTCFRISGDNAFAACVRRAIQ